VPRGSRDQQKKASKTWAKESQSRNPGGGLGEEVKKRENRVYRHEIRMGGEGKTCIVPQSRIAGEIEEKRVPTIKVEKKPQNQINVKTMKRDQKIFHGHKGDDEKLQKKKETRKKMVKKNHGNTEKRTSRVNS